MLKSTHAAETFKKQTEKKKCQKINWTSEQAIYHRNVINSEAFANTITSSNYIDQLLKKNSRKQNAVMNIHNDDIVKIETGAIEIEDPSLVQIEQQIKIPASSLPNLAIDETAIGNDWEVISLPTP